MYIYKFSPNFLSIYLYFYLSLTFLSIYLAMYLSVLSYYLYVYPSIYLFICLSICLLICLSIYLSIYKSSPTVEPYSLDPFYAIQYLQIFKTERGDLGKTKKNTLHLTPSINQFFRSFPNKNNQNY